MLREKPADIYRMMLAHEEICIITNTEREVIRYFGQLVEALGSQRPMIFEYRGEGGILGEYVLQVVSHPPVHGAAERRELIERWLREDD